ncbi:hypothetical protein GCM10022225_25550 [Plantactinospora mayteni]|uniref:Fe2OG dioxygenase domain-containing protein n=1 Tax=Plantactinospora mayteni TaxID=566021 RepID=A0ABQ4EJB4_9ACTN|nr:2OG-Fe(II) oxygenase [Plantactinospora mayteni]GIG94715.1 hypothetical protein Pma05_12880 [Plantactinospora mayteni]
MSTASPRTEHRPTSAGRPHVSAERLHTGFPIVRLDYRGRLPAGWQRQVVDCAETYREWSLLGGESVTSRQRQLGSAASCPVGVVTGKVVGAELSWLDALYREELLDLANGLGLGTFEPSADERSAINVNVLPPGSEYEWHVDSNPVTALLFGTDQPAGTGGELVFRPDPVTRPTEDWELAVVPRAGDLLLFDGREAAHSVRPVRGATERLTVPMNFYFAGAGVTRPDDLDRYLYGE